MRADELLVERFLELEKKLELSKKIIEDLQYDNETAQEELADYENLVRILSKYLKSTKYGVSFEIKNYIEEEKADIDYLANFFELDLKEENGEGGD